MVEWNGSSFVALGSGLIGEVNELIVWNGALVAGGAFTQTGAGASFERVAIYDEESNEWAQRIYTSCDKNVLAGTTATCSASRAS